MQNLHNDKHTSILSFNAGQQNGFKKIVDAIMPCVASSNGICAIFSVTSISINHRLQYIKVLPLPSTAVPFFPLPLLPISLPFTLSFSSVPVRQARVNRQIILPKSIQSFQELRKKSKNIIVSVTSAVAAQYLSRGERQVRPS